jgi:hypothetical protein
MDRKPEAVAATCADGMAKLEKIKQLGITADMSQDDQDALVESLSEAKAIENECDIKEVRSGQRWYVESLVEFAGLEPEEQFEHLYRKQFAKTANEAEILDVFRSFKAD